MVTLYHLNFSLKIVELKYIEVQQSAFQYNECLIVQNYIYLLVDMTYIETTTIGNETRKLKNVATKDI